MSNVWESLQESLYFYRQHFFRLALLVVPAVLPLFIFSEYRVVALLHGDSSLAEQDPWLLGLNALASVLAGAITTLYAVAEIDGHALPAWTILGRALLVVPSLLALELLIFFAFLGGFLFLVVPGFWLVACLMPAFVYVAVERMPVPQAMQRSYERFRPVAWQLLGALAVAFLAFLLTVLPSVMLLTAISSLPGVLERVLLDALVYALGLLLNQFSRVLVVRYYDMQRQGVLPGQQV